MRQLQNNFTTPEQSKRLLELGMPANSADCALLLNKSTNQYDYVVINNQDDYNFMGDNTFPCWSVGQLIKIYLVCYDGLIDTSFNFEPSDADNIVELVIEKIVNKKHKMNFSKLDK